MFEKTMIVGDVHLGKGSFLGKNISGSLYNTRYLDQINLLHWILQQAEINEIDTIIFTGDIFEDAKPDYYLLFVFVQFLLDISKLGIECHIIIGNHDLKRIGNSLYSILDIIDIINIENVYVHKNIYSFNKGTVSFTLIPFIDRRTMNFTSQQDVLSYLKDKINNEYNILPKENTKVVIGHLALEGSLYVGDEIDDLSNEIFCPLEFFKNYDYVWMGHIHKPQILSIKPYISHIGSLDISNFEEKNQIKILVVLDQNNKEYFYTITVPSRPLKNFSFEIPDPEDDKYTSNYSTDYLISLLEKENLEKAIVKIDIKLQPICPPINRDIVHDFLYNQKKVNYLCAFSESRKNIIFKKDKLIVDNAIEPKKAVLLWAKKKGFSPEEESEFIQRCNNIIDKSQKK